MSNKKRVMITGENGFTAGLLEDVFMGDSRYEVVWSGRMRDDSLCDFTSMYNTGKELDVRDRGLFETVVIENQPDLIIHTAGIVGTELCNLMPRLASESNVYGSIVVAKVAAENGCKLMYFSTTAVYDPFCYSKDDPIEEGSVQYPRTIYGITKYAGELAVKSIMPINKLIVVRPCFMFGGSRDNHSTISRAIKSIQDGDKFDVLMDPDNYKDYIYVKDAVNAFKVLADKDTFGEFNISNGNPRPFREYVADVERIMGGKVKFRYHPEKDYLHSHVVINHKMCLMGWQPQYSFEQSIRDILEHEHVC